MCGISALALKTNAPTLLREDRPAHFVKSLEVWGVRFNLVGHGFRDLRSWSCRARGFEFGSARSQGMSVCLLKTRRSLVRRLKHVLCCLQEALTYKDTKGATVFGSSAHGLNVLGLLGFFFQGSLVLSGLRSVRLKLGKLGFRVLAPFP